jgi:hypothetical protein
MCRWHLRAVADCVIFWFYFPFLLCNCAPSTDKDSGSCSFLHSFRKMSVILAYLCSYRSYRFSRACFHLLTNFNQFQALVAIGHRCDSPDRTGMVYLLHSTGLAPVHLLALAHSLSEIHCEPCCNRPVGTFVFWLVLRLHLSNGFFLFQD